MNWSTHCQDGKVHAVSGVFDIALVRQHYIYRFPKRKKPIFNLSQTNNKVCSTMTHPNAFFASSFRLPIWPNVGRPAATLKINLFVNPTAIVSDENGTLNIKQYSGKEKI